MRSEVVKVLSKAIKQYNGKLSEEEIEKLIEIPPNTEMGDFAFPCFVLSKQFKESPNILSVKLREQIGNPPKTFEDIQSVGPYINFFVNRKILAYETVFEILKQKNKYGSSQIGKGKKVLVEFSSPNIAKPFGIGHLRSTIIGNSIANICKFNSYKVIRANYLGDWGTQFGKLLYGYEKFGSEKELKKDAIKHLLNVYVKVNLLKDSDEKGREYFKKLESGDKKLTILWNKFKDLSLKEFEKIYFMLGIKFDVYLAESMYEKKIYSTINLLKKKDLLRKSEGAWIVDLRDYGLDVCIIKKSDGATTYAVRDLASAISRYKKFKFDKMIYEVGQEQKLHLAQVFKILELSEFKWAKDCFHADHGLYLDKDGKKFATRKGKTIFMEDILNDTTKLSEKEIKKRFPKLSKTELEERASKVAIAAIFYGDLKNNRANNMVFDLERFTCFEGDTGPYLLYSYARASSILKKSGKKLNKKFEINTLTKEENELIKKLAQFNESVLGAYMHSNPSTIANYSFQLAQCFNEFYHACPVIDSREEDFRLSLIESFRIVLKNALGLLGIETLEEM